MFRAAWLAALAAVLAGAPRDAGADEGARGEDGLAALDPAEPADVEETGPSGPDDLPWVDAELMPIPDEEGVPLDQRFPVLAAWVHPVADTKELVPVRWQRKYGAVREGGKGGKGNRKGCKRRHCGIDLGGPRGRTIVSAMDGVVKHIERRRNGKDGQSGRYVRISHADGVFTAYMHLDSIAPGLGVGDTVTAGQYIGRLGRSGIRHGDAHLHFNLEIPGVDGSTKWDETRLIDSTPFLQRAKVIPDPAPRRSRGKRADS
jgi:murein DD-endopeptidase MepM/ murein hydrolase activator NlpD